MKLRADIDILHIPDQAHCTGMYRGGSQILRSPIPRHPLGQLVTILQYWLQVIYRISPWMSQIYITMGGLRPCL